MGSHRDAAYFRTQALIIVPADRLFMSVVRASSPETVRPGWPDYRGSCSAGRNDDQGPERQSHHPGQGG